jgi:exodeoxyribonuclease VII large subunit
MQLRATRLRGLEQRLAALNPAAILGRGYAVVAFPDGRSVRSVGQVKSGDALDVHVRDGKFGVEVQNRSEREPDDRGTA